MRVILLTIIIGLFAGCDLNGQTIQNISFVNRLDAAQIRVLEPGVVLFYSVSEWQAFWSANHENKIQNKPLPPLPRVNFEDNVLIGIFWGSRSGCATNTYPVESVKSIVSNGREMVVEVTELRDLGLCRAMSWPLQIIEVPKVNEAVEFVGTLPS